MMIIARAGLFEHIYCIKFEIVTCHTQLSKLEMLHIDAVKCVQRQVQHTLSEVQVIVNAEFEATIRARVSPIIVLKVFLVGRLGIVLGFERANLGPIIVLNVFPVERLLRFVSLGALCSRDWR